MTMPLVGVAPTKLIKGISDFDEPCQELTCVSLKEALEKQWNTDAHFFTYQPENHTAWPRLRDEILPKIEKTGTRLLKQCIVLDYDNPDHKPWDGELFAAFLDRFNVVSQNPVLSEWAAFYTTSGGCRFIYIPDKPLTVRDAEGLHKAVIRDFGIFGLDIDVTCAQWTRCFRLPQVVRDGIPTWVQSYYLQEFQWDKRLRTAEIIPFGSLTPENTPVALEEKPSTQASLLLLKNRDGTDTEWVKRVKKKLRSKSCYDVIFKDALLAEHGERDVKIQSYVGEAIATLFKLEGTSVKLIYALFLPAIAELTPDAQTPDWTTVLWRSCLRYWSSESAKSKEKDLEIKEREQKAQSLARQILAVVRQWCSAPELKDADFKAREWIQSKLIVGTPTNSYYIMTPQGYYDSIPVSKDRLPARVRELGMAALMPLWVPAKQGDFRQVRYQELIDAHCTTISAIEGAISVPGSYVRSLGNKDSTLVQRLFGLKQHFPGEFNQEVDVWLKLFAGRHYEIMQHWIAWSLDFDAGPICALSISGPPGLGKKLLVQGLAENLDSECVADAKEMGRFQSLLLKSPFLIINEGFPDLGGKDPADTFRHLVSGDPIPVEQKFRDTIVIRNPVRMIFTANNEDVVHKLSLNRDMTPYDREALAIRLLHMNCTEAAAEWLRRQGGLQYTQGWIKSDSGGPSTYKVAKHFRWLYDQRHLFPRGNRLLVEGEINNETIRIISPKGGKAPEIIETLINMVENTPEAGDQKGRVVVTKDGNIYVTTAGVADYWRCTTGKYSRQNISPIDVGRTIKSFIHRQDKEHPRKMRFYLSQVKIARWRQIDPCLLYQEGIQHGYNCKRLEEINQKIIKTQSDELIKATTSEPELLPPVPHNESIFGNSV